MPSTPQRALAPSSGAQDAMGSTTSLSPTPTVTSQFNTHTSPRASARLNHAPPLLALAPSAIPDLGQPEEDISVIWNVISRAADVVKDGKRLENLAWRHWGAPRTGFARRRRSSSATAATDSSIEIATPSERSSSLHRSPSFERRTFTGTLKLLVEETNFKDWVGDAQKHQPEKMAATHPTSSESMPATPALAPPDTPGPSDLEIRLVEPTPAPSRVGSLGGSVPTNHIAKPNLVPENIKEVVNEGDEQEQARSRRANKDNRFFIQSSPGQVSGSSSSQPSSIPRVAPPEADAQVAGSLGSHRRSSAESSSAIVIKKKERRHVSMANMRGRFAGEKARAAEAIAARNSKPNSEDEWEDEDDDEEAGEEEAGEEEGEGDGDDDDWEDEPSMSEKPPPTAPLRRAGSRAPPPAPTPPKSKKERAAEKAKVDAEREAQRQREMFAKRQIFGAPQASEGLLTRTFRNGSGRSMVDLSQAGHDDEHHALRRAPTAAQLTTLGSSPAGPSLLRSKSTAAVPLQTGVSVTSRSHHSANSDDRPRAPPDVEMETSDESEDDDYLQSEEVRAKLNALAAKRAERERAKTVPQPVAATAAGDLDQHGIVRPLSPTSRRRKIIMSEMSESLRKNIIIEREKSSGRPPNMQGPHKRPPPSVHMSKLPTSSSAINLAQYHAALGGEPLARHRSNHAEEFKRAELERHNSHPDLSGMHKPESTSPQPQHPASVSPELRRRTNVLGSGFLRPLTRVEGGGLGRTQSVAALSGMKQTSPTIEYGNPHSQSSASGASAGSDRKKTHLQAPPMVRSSTEGQKNDDRAKLRRELARRGDDTNPSYRFHGW